MDSKSWESLKKSKSKLLALLKEANIPSAMSKASWAAFTSTERKKIEKALKKQGSGWFEEKEEVVTKKGIEKKAPIHREVAIKERDKNLLDKPISAPEKKDEPIRVEKPTDLQPWQMTSAEAISETPKQNASKVINWIRMREALSKSRQEAESTHKLMVKLALALEWAVPDKVKAEYPDLQAKSLSNNEKALIEKFQSRIETATLINELENINADIVDAVANGKLESRQEINKLHENVHKKIKELEATLPLSDVKIKVSELTIGDTIQSTTTGMRLKVTGMTDSEVLLQFGHYEKPVRKAKIRQGYIEDYEVLESKYRELKKLNPSVYENLIKRIASAVSIKELDEINHEANKAEIKGEITDAQLQELYMQIRARDKEIRALPEPEFNVGDFFRLKPDIQTIYKHGLYTIIDKTPRDEMVFTMGSRGVAESAPTKRKIYTYRIASVDEYGEQTPIQAAELKYTDIKATFNKVEIPPDSRVRMKIPESASFSKGDYLRIRPEWKGKGAFISAGGATVVQINPESIYAVNDVSDGKVSIFQLRVGQKEYHFLANLSQKEVYEKLEKIPKPPDIPEFQHPKKIDIQALINKLAVVASWEDLRELTPEIDKIRYDYSLKGNPDVMKFLQALKAKYEELSLMGQAKTLPKKLQVKEYTQEEINKQTWGLSEADAFKKHAEHQVSKYQSNIDYTLKQQAEFAEVQEKYEALSKEEQKDPKNAQLRYKYYALKDSLNKNLQALPHWTNVVERIKAGGYLSKENFREQYVKEVKKAISSGKPVPESVIAQYPEFKKAQGARERYEKGRHTSFANVSVAVDTTLKDLHGIKVKRQDGKAITQKQKEQIVEELGQIQRAIGDITPILRREDITIAHTSGTHPFLSTASGMYHQDEKTVTMGFPGVTAHEISHAISNAANHEILKAEKKGTKESLYDFKLLGTAKATMNTGVEQAISLSKAKTPEQLAEARKLRVYLGAYWERPEEIFARLAEQYVAYKNQIETEAHLSFKEYTLMPGWWSERSFMEMLPMIEAELQRKIRLARG